MIIKPRSAPQFVAALISAMLLFTFASVGFGQTLNWTEASTATAHFTRRISHSSVVFQDKMWVIGGSGDSNFTNDVWSSSDGAAWTLETAAAAFTGRQGHTSVVFKDKMWIIGGSDGAMRNDVWSSSDGTSWTQATAAAEFPARDQHASVVFDNKMWVMGGLSNSNLQSDVWSSTDGTSWTQATAAAPFAARFGLSSVVFDNKMWVIGGSSANGYEHDVWSSTNGTSWTLVKANAPFPGRVGHTTVVYDNRMWVIAGNSTDVNHPYLNDVWSSPDGINWTQSISTAIFAGRFLHSSVVLAGKMWVMGGLDGSNARDDVWSGGLEPQNRARNWAAYR